MQSQATTASTRPGSSSSNCSSRLGSSASWSFSQSRAKIWILLLLGLEVDVECLSKKVRCFGPFAGFGARVFCSMFCPRHLKTYSWSVGMYLPTLGAMVMATIPAMPHPNSRIVEFWPSIPLCDKIFSDEAIQSANRGVIFQTTDNLPILESVLSRSPNYFHHQESIPAPVVPPCRFDANTTGDCWMLKSLPAAVTSRTVALGLIMPRSWEGIGCEKRRKDSNGIIRLRMKR